MDRRIIVLTPTKNEEWIIEIFLKVTLMFADHVIIADQQSTDRTVAICQSFDRVTVIQNEGTRYDEAYRQELLIATARKMFPGEKIVFALDADEIMAASSIKGSDWALVQSAAPGTVFYVEKPELYKETETTIRYRDRFYPLAFVDDDSLVHQPQLVHSIRIPMREDAVQQHLTDTKIMHVAYLRPAVQRSKYRFYAVQENVLQTSPWYRRRRRYRNGSHLLYWESLERTPKEWLAYPIEAAVHLEDVKDQPVSWYDMAVLKLFQQHGTTRFWLDDIWDQDWNTLSKDADNSRFGSPPPLLLTFLLKLSDRFNK